MVQKGSMSSQAFLLFSFLGLPAVLVFFVFLIPLPLMSQSTSAAQTQSVSEQSEKLSLSKVSSELRKTLKELAESYPLLVAESSSLRDQVRSLSEQVSELSSSSETWEAESKRLTDSVQSLTMKFSDYQKASEDKDRIEAEAIKVARKERDDAKDVLPLVAVVSAFLGALSALGLSIFF